MKLHTFVVAAVVFVVVFQIAVNLMVLFAPEAPTVKGCLKAPSRKML